MPLKIVRNDITLMKVDAVVNTASSSGIVGYGCDTAIHKAAGLDELQAERSKIGTVPEGESFITSGFNLPAKYIIHTVSPRYIDGESGEEDRLRNCYRNSLKIALDRGLSSIAFPLISTGSFGYPREEGIRIAIDEINAFLIKHDMLIYIVVFDADSSELGKRITGSLESYIDDKYVSMMMDDWARYTAPADRLMDMSVYSPMAMPNVSMDSEICTNEAKAKSKGGLRRLLQRERKEETCDIGATLDDRIAHMSDTFSQYLLYLIERNGMTNADVYKRAVVDKKVFSKIKNNVSYHPNKITAMCLCVGAQLNIDDTKDLLARAGYALSPCDKMDVIFSYFIEHEIFDIIEIDIALEEHDLPCLIQ